MTRARADLRPPLVAAASILAMLLAGCAPRPDLSPRPSAVRTVAHVQQRWLLLRVSASVADGRRHPLVLFVTGDGGWRGKDLDAFDHLVQWGYAVAGFSAPEYLDHLADGAESLSPTELARDFKAIIDASCNALRLAEDTPVLLAGVSRGADLVVIAAADPLLQGRVGGTLAVALTDEEQFVRHPRRMFHRPASTTTTVQPDADLEEPVVANPYDVLPWVQAPVCVIQSTRDKYVPAAAARTLFGPESPTRQFHAIAARNHSFAGSRDELYQAMHASLDWLASSSSAPPPGSVP